jgi:Domain of unknown function (DUF1906)/Putative peptidoglycan binding domain
VLTVPVPQPGADFDEAGNPAVPAAAAAQYGFDYAWQPDTPAGLVALLNANQATFVLRYVNDAVPGGKGIMAGEAAALQAAGIIIGALYETTGVDFTGGYDAGVTAGADALACMSARGAQAGAYCWFAIDTDTGDYAATNSYLQGAKAATGSYIAQLYGSYGVVEAAYAAGLGDKHYQTYAWSAGQLSAHAALYQYQNDVTVGGISMDRDRTLQPMRGPWADFTAPDPPGVTYLTAAQMETIMGSLPVLSSGMTDTSLPYEYIRRLQAILRYVYGYYTGAIDGTYGPATAAAVKTLQARYGLTQDSVCGPLTWMPVVTGAT